MQVDGRWRVVTDAGRFAGFLDSVVVVAGSVDCSWAGAFAAFRVEFAGKAGQVAG